MIYLKETDVSCGHKTIQMSPIAIVVLISLYFLVLIGIYFAT